VFARPDGSVLPPKALAYRWQQMARKAGLPVIHLHDGRHTHATLGLAAGVPVKVMSERLGHASTAITENLYQHVLPKMDDDAATLIAAQVVCPTG
jgi:integrase